MNPWRDLFRSLQAELDRLSQEVDGRRVLPNSIEAALPIVNFESWTPVLKPVTVEIGEALVEWAGRGRRQWYGEGGPSLRLYLDSCSQTQIVCEFVEPPNDGNDALSADSEPI